MHQLSVMQPLNEKYLMLPVIIYGHSHQAGSEVVRGALMFNPGAARSSYGILTVDKELKTEIDAVRGG